MEPSATPPIIISALTLNPTLALTATLTLALTSTLAPAPAPAASDAPRSTALAPAARIACARAWPLPKGTALSAAAAKQK